MNRTASICTSIVMLAMGSWATSAYADSNDAMCEVRKDGETKQGQSGPCTFSQRQGYIDLDMRNGETYSLAPGNQPNRFKDQKGNKVVRTQAGGNTQEFKWEGGKKIIVTFGTSSSSSGAWWRRRRSPCRRRYVPLLRGRGIGEVQGQPARHHHAERQADAGHVRGLAPRPEPMPRYSSARSTPNGNS